jgi:hypothetical protein
MKNSTDTKVRDGMKAFMMGLMVDIMEGCVSIRGFCSPLLFQYTVYRIRPVMQPQDGVPSLGLKGLVRISHLRN